MTAPRLWVLVGLTAVAAAVNGCSCAGTGIDGEPFACANDAQCDQPDWVCRRGACVKVDAGCAAALEICDDGLENDCDDLIDCADDECANLGCGQAGRLCQANACECPPPGQDGGFTETNCQDGLDDDCDGVSDCADSDCDQQVCDVTGLVCNGGSCACPLAGADGGITPESACNDGVDNDCDGKPDCADGNCAGAACSVAGTCAGLVCDCSAAGGAPETPEATCDDGLDNDCDTLTDCADVTDCDTRTCGLDGLICNASGACVCGGNGGTAQPAGETTCSDTKDNDCDGQADCNDPGCNTLACGTNGRVCSGTSCVCGGNGGTAEPSGETICDDGHDNDCDTRVDCAESFCSGKACGLNGRFCSGTSCVCTGNGGAPEPTGEVSCSDGFDNDCDGLSDCDDPGCTGVTCGAGAGFQCTAGGACACSGNGGTPEPGGETICTDNADNDCNGLRDCGEAACDAQACGANGKACSGGSCLCTGNGGAVETTEASCSDGFDNDCDGAIDCADPNCSHKSCSTTSAASVCCGTACRDLSSDETSCGGCGFACDTSPNVELCSAAVVSTGLSGHCSCDSNAECPTGQTAQQACMNTGTQKECVCTTSAQCRSGQVCDTTSGFGICRY